MKESDYMPLLAGVKSAKRAGLGRWSSGKGAAEAWRLPAAPLSLPIFFPLRVVAEQTPAPPERVSDGIQLDLSL